MPEDPAQDAPTAADGAHVRPTRTGRPRRGSATSTRPEAENAEAGNQNAQSAPVAHAPTSDVDEHQQADARAGDQTAAHEPQPHPQPSQRPTRMNRPDGRPQRTFGQGGSNRGAVPYSPGGRGPQRGGYDQQQPRAPYGQSNGGNQPSGPYAPHNRYSQYDPYAGPNAGQGTQQDRPAGGRPVRGRSYGDYGQYGGDGQQGHERGGYQDGRGGRSSIGGRGDQGGYNDRGSMGRRNNLRTPGHDRRTPHDRRGMGDARGGYTDTRGSRNRPGRDTSERGLYTNVPAQGQQSRYGGYSNRQPAPLPPTRGVTVDISGIVWLGGGHGISPAELLDQRTLTSVARFNPEDARRLGLRSGDIITGHADERNGRRVVTSVDLINNQEPEQLAGRPLFEQLTATFPTERIHLEQGRQPLISTRLIDLFSPLGFGSRALVVAPPKTGKTTLIREAAEAVLAGYPDAVVMAVLVGERPEEVTDLRARLEPRGGHVYAASFDEETERHAWLVQVAVERAKRVAESGRDAFMVLDSLTRLARAENLASRGQGRTLSGGIDAQALDTGRRAFGAARKLEEGGSLTILATTLVDTGSRQDDVVYEEFKGTGNMELHLSRDLAQRRLFPAVDVMKSSTRREEMLLSPEELRASTALRRKLADLPTLQATQQLLSVLERTPSNSALLQALEQSGWVTSAPHV